MKQTKTYMIWGAMIQRCHNPKNKKYKTYGARGIFVCERWRIFYNFLEDMGEKPDGMSLDRIDNNDGYYKNNCRWADARTQTRNKRDNVFLTHNGVTLIQEDWAKILGISRNALRNRLRNKWPLERIFAPKELDIFGQEIVSGVKKYAYNGEEHPLSVWAKKLGLETVSLQQRVRKGWPIHEVLSPRKR